MHQSARDFLFAKTYDETFPDGSEVVHQAIFLRSLAMLSKTLHRDMYSLEAPGYPIENVQLLRADPLAVLRYPCISWIDHLCDSKPNYLADRAGNLQVLGAVDDFLREKFLYWLEGLSLCKSVGNGVILIEKLWSLVQVYHTRSTFVYYNLDADASRRRSTMIALLSLFKTHGDSSCIIEGQLRITLSRHMHLR